MDPASAIGTASAVLTFAQITVQGVQLAAELVRRMSEPPKYIKDTLDALELLQGIQRDIKASTVSQSEHAGKNIIKACERCSASVEEILATLKKVERSSRDGMMAKAKNALDTMLYEDDVKKQIQDLGDKKQDLLLALVSPSTVAGTMEAALTPAINELLATNAFSRSVNAAASDIPSDQSGVDKFLRELCVEKPQDVRRRLIKAKGNRVGGTCSWVLEHKAYQSWLAGTEQGLWINGDPGKGKTMTSIFLTQELERHTVESDGVLLYFFCDSQFEKRRTQLGFIQSLIHQLCLARPPLASRCLTEFQQHGRVAVNSTETLWRCARTILESFGEGPVFILVDGLDECDAKSVVEICQELASLHTLSSDGQRKVRPIIISRPLDAKCGRHLAKFRQVQLNGANKHIGRDLSIFIHSRVRTIAEQNGYKTALHESVLKTVLRKSEGTFLWAGLVLSDLEDTETVDVEDCLASLPSQLDGIYDRILQEIPAEKAAVVEKILKWVVFAVRPLTVLELAGAISRPEETPSTIEFITARIGMCRHLLSISQDVVKLVHQSARDYLTSGVRPSTIPQRFSLNARQAHSEITQLCISKMTDRLKTAKSSNVFDDVWCPARVAISPTLEAIMDYSIEYWHHHARLSDGWSPIHDSFVSTFLETESCRNWLHFCHIDFRIPCPEKMLLKSKVHLASFLGLKSIVSASINKSGFDAKRLLPFRHPESLLACAGLFGGRTDIVELLVKKEGASIGKVPARSSFFSSPIHIAAATNNVPALKLLLGKRTDLVNRLDGNCWAPLHHAALWDSAEACQYLISKGAHVNVLDRALFSPLYYAALPARSVGLYGKHKMYGDYYYFLEAFPTITTATILEGGHPRKTNAVQVLLDAKANPNPAPGGSGLYTPLHNAIRYGRAQEVEALVRAGADTTVKDKEGRNALYAVISDYCSTTAAEEIATILVDAGAKLDPELELKRPFMLGAIERNSLSLVKLAIRLSTDLSYIDDEGHSFLYYAAITCSNEIVDFLLEAGASINRDPASLSAAANRGHWKLCKLILEGNTQPKVDDAFRWNCTIQSLTTDYDPSIVKAIIKAGADPNEPSFSHGTPLITAIIRGSHEVVVDLLAEGADVKLQRDDTNALEFALLGRHEPIVKSLLAAGAKTVSGISPLGYVSIKGFHKMVGFLVSQEGADPNEETSTGYTPIEMASAMGRDKTVAELVRAGADASMASSSRIMALSEAASNDRGETGRMLLGDDWADPVGFRM